MPRGRAVKVEGRPHNPACAGDEPVVLTRRGRAEAFLVGRDEYAEFKLKRSAAARGELEQTLREVRKRIADTGLDVAGVDEAIAAACRLD